MNTSLGFAEFSDLDGHPTVTTGAGIRHVIATVVRGMEHENAAALVKGGLAKFRQECTASPGKALSPPRPGPCADDPRNLWAARHGFLRDGKGLEGFSDFQYVLQLLDQWQINADNLRQEQKIDEGSFGSIFAGAPLLGRGCVLPCP